MRVAAMDVGTNSVHMIVAQVDPDGHFRVLDRAKEMVRLGRSGLTHHRLTGAAMDAGVRKPDLVQSHSKTWCCCGSAMGGSAPERMRRFTSALVKALSKGSKHRDSLT